MVRNVPVKLASEKDIGGEDSRGQRGRYPVRAQRRTLPAVPRDASAFHSPFPY